MNRLSIHIPLLVKLTAVAAYAFAAFKVFFIAQSYGAFVAITFAGMHLPLCLFSALIVVWFFDDHQAIGFLALASTLLNAVLI